MDTIQWGIIGCGNVTEVKSGPALQKASRSKLVAVMRRDADKAADYAARHNVPKWYTDAADLINDPAVNAVYIATPPAQHEMYALQVLAAGKPVYIEKPMALNAAACQRLSDAAAASGIKMVIAHYRRALPMFVKVKELIDAKAIGDIRTIQLDMLMSRDVPKIAQTKDNWRVDPTLSGGGYFHDLAPHQLDLLLHWFGRPEKMSGFGVNQSRQYAADDTVVGQMLFQGHVPFTGTWCFTVAKDATKEWCQISGTEGSIGFPFFGNHVVLKQNGIENTLPFDHPAHIQQPLIEQIVPYFLGEAENPCPPEEATSVMEMLDIFTKK